MRRSTDLRNSRRINRRRLLALAGAGATSAVGAARFASTAGRADSSAVPSIGASASETIAGLGQGFGGGIGLSARSLDYLLRAVETAPSMSGRADLLAEAWNEGESLWLDAAALMPEVDFRVLVSTDSEGGAASDLVVLSASARDALTLDDFLAGEQEILDRWPDLRLAGLDGLDEGSRDSTSRLLSKFLAAAGIGDAYKAILAILDESDYLWLIGQAIKARDARLLLSAIEELLDFMLGRRFFARLAGELGERQARRLVGRIAGRFVPYLGWSLFIGQLIWAFAEQADLSWLKDWPVEPSP